MSLPAIHRLKSEIQDLRFKPSDRYWMKTCRLICDQYGVEFEYSKHSQCSYYSPKKKLIVLRARKNKKKPQYLIEFCHELAHFVQNKICSIDRSNIDKAIAYERQAEMLAYHIHAKYFGFKHHQCFSAYRSRKDINFLLNYSGLTLSKKEDNTSEINHNIRSIV